MFLEAKPFDWCGEIVVVGTGETGQVNDFARPTKSTEHFSPGS